MATTNAIKNQPGAANCARLISLSDEEPRLQAPQRRCAARDPGLLVVLTSRAGTLLTKMNQKIDTLPHCLCQLVHILRAVVRRAKCILDLLVAEFA